MDEKQNSQDEFNRSDITQRFIGLIGIIIFIGSLRILDALGLSAPIAFFIAGILDLFVTYWITPRPRVPFRRYAPMMVLFCLWVVVAFWPIPALLSKTIPVELAYALPAFVFTLSLYGLPIIVSGKRMHWGKNKHEIAFINWILGCGVVSLIVGGVVMILHLFTHTLK